jgi:hypothetical protein
LSNVLEAKLLKEEEASEVEKTSVAAAWLGFGFTGFPSNSA